MTEWFTPEVSRWFALFSLLSLLAFAAPWIARGQHKTLITTLYAVALGIGCVLLGLSVVARIVEQPVHVIRPLTLAGVVLTVIFGVMIGVVRAGYAQAEERKMLAMDM
jgi:hypothetical protein